MPRISTVKPRVGVVNKKRVRSVNTSERRITGRKLQDRRLRIWKANPCCSECGRITAYPYGFELDHLVPLHQGGPDTDANCQVLCVDFEMVAGEWKKIGCHAAKTLADEGR